MRGNVRMNDLYIYENKKIGLPLVILLKNGDFLISGNSIPDDADEFYFQIIKYIAEFIKLKRNIRFTFKFIYYNTASKRYLNRIMNLMQDAKKLKIDVNIFWYYSILDEDMQEMGMDFKEIYELNIKLIKIKT